MKKLIITIAVLVCTAAAFAQTVEEKSCQVAPDCRIRVINTVGSVNVTAWDRSEVQLKATLGPDVERLDFTCTDSVVRVDVIAPTQGSRKIESNLDISVPSGSSLDIETVSADTHTYNVAGRLMVTSVSGNLLLENVVGAVSAKSVSGDITISGSSPALDAVSVSGDVKISATVGELRTETVSGSADISGTVAQLLAKSISGRLSFSGTATAARAETVSGNIDLDRADRELEAHTTSGRMNLVGNRISSGRFTSMSGNIAYTGEVADKGCIEGSSKSGSITIYTSENPVVLYDLSTNSGDIETFYNVPARSRQEHGRGSMLRLGQEGGASIVMDTASGNIRVKHR